MRLGDEAVFHREADLGATRTLGPSGLLCAPAGLLPPAEMVRVLNFGDHSIFQEADLNSDTFLFVGSGFTVFVFLILLITLLDTPKGPNSGNEDQREDLGTRTHRAHVQGRAR